ncbi:O-antigen ligase family protein [Erythrobacter litoralis]|uniref:Uncharacterized protein n=1 Tax=Erythrobacter litoralis (strain HTCC2594) TaxID=314225 RepID=Q2N6D9_ERYLH|nr:O-antigen ligase family protein [Erythrobacter litoralis]ABC64752.1 hypothetical protein ELI_13300 [Erythrobacter litoralis HTCC2594]
MNADQSRANAFRLVRLAIGGGTFWLLFAGYFLYHFLLARDLIPELFGGMFGPVLAASLPFTLWGTFLASRNLPGIFSNGVAVWVSATVLWASFWLAIHFAQAPDNVAHAQVGITIVLWLGMLALCFNIPVYSPLFNKILLGSWALIAFLAMAFVDASTLMTETMMDEDAASYQGLARGLMVVGTFVLCVQRNIISRIGIAAVTIAALFAIGARSELYGFIAGYGVVEAIINRRSLLAQFVLAVVVMLTAWLVLQNLDYLSTSRQLQILDLSQSSSWVAREYMLIHAQNQVLENPLFGIYGGHWELGEGDYAHNALSAWVSFGFPGFLLYVVTIIVATAVALVALLKNPTSRLAMLATLINVSNVLLVAVAKPVFWEMPALGWGLAILVIQEMRVATSVASARTP